MLAMVALDDLVEGVWDGRLLHYCHYTGRRSEAVGIPQQRRASPSIAGKWTVVVPPRHMHEATARNLSELLIGRTPQNSTDAISRAD